MTASLESIRERIDIAQTTHNKGLVLTLVITAYDNGMINIGDRPATSGPLDSEGVSALSWLQCSEYISGYLIEFCRQVEQRRRTQNETTA
jgi:hypothetical protein